MDLIHNKKVNGVFQVQGDRNRIWLRLSTMRLFWGPAANNLVTRISLLAVY